MSVLLGALLVAAIGVAFANRVRLVSRWLGLPVPSHAVRRETTHVAMPDGACLATDVYHPRTGEPQPTILIRTPYGRRGLILMFGLVPRLFASHGVHLVVQDTRGRYGSEGEWDPFRHEADDGCATLEWIGKQAWFDGRLATWGASYFGLTQWAIAADPPVPIQAMVPIVTCASFHDIFWVGGAFSLASAARWASGVVGRRSRFPREGRLARAFRSLPATTIDEATADAPVAFYREWIARPHAADPYWRAIDFASGIPRTDAAMLVVAGWWDIFVGPQIRDWQRLRREGRSEAARSARLVVGPWAHGRLATRPFPPREASLIRKVAQESIVWFERWLRGGGAGDVAPVEVFTTGVNRWQSLDDFPPPSASETPLFLRSRGRAATRSGDGYLCPEPPEAGEPPDSFAYDPLDPVPTCGGTFLGPKCGPADQRAVEDRSDVLCYTSRPLDDPLEATGFVRLALFARTDAPATDFTAKLVDVRPDGFAMNLCEGITRIISCPGPSGAQEIGIDLWAISHVFDRGHRIRLEVSSSNHPRFARHLNEVGPPEHGTTSSVAVQSVFHDATHPSRLVLPVVSRSSR